MFPFKVPLIVIASLILLSDIRRGLVEEAMTYGGDVMRSNAGPGWLGAGAGVWQQLWIDY